MANESDEPTGEEVAGVRAAQGAARSPIEQAVWNYLGTEDAALLIAFFEKLQGAARSGVPLDLSLKDGVLEWEGVK